LGLHCTRMLWQLSSRCSRVAIFLLLVGCGGQAHSNNADVSSGGTTSDGAGRGPVGGSVSSAGGYGASQAGSANIGGSAQAGGASNGGNAQAGSASVGGNELGGSTSTGGNAQAGTAGVGSAAGGAPGAAGADPNNGGPTAIAAACSTVCDAQGDCPEGGGAFSPTCKTDCSTAVAAGGEGCTAAGVDMLSCLSAALQDKSRLCAERFSPAKQSCAMSIASYRSCAAGNGSPGLAPILCVHISRSSSDGGTPGCMEDLNCLNNLINTLWCNESAEHAADCSCFTKFSRHDVTVSDPAPTVCKARFDECLATGTLAP